jgi:hypothetical protein
VRPVPWWWHDRQAVGLAGGEVADDEAVVGEADGVGVVVDGPGGCRSRDEARDLVDADQEPSTGKRGHTSGRQ